MHGLFLGTAKKMIKIWRTTICDLTHEFYLTVADLKAMQKEANDIVLPAQYTSIHQKISNNFSDLKADEWGTWRLALSPILLKSRLPVPQKENWAKFVQACHIVCRPSITRNGSVVAHKLFHEFVTGVVKLYGSEVVTPNMHFHLHLKDSIQDFGPIYAFWLYGFERLNGDIKKMTVNYKAAFEATYMKKFLSVVHYGDYVRNLPPSIRQNPTMMSSFGYLSPTPSDPLVSSSLCASQCFDFSSFVSAPLCLNNLFTGAEVLPPGTQVSIQRKVSMNRLNRSDYGHLLSFDASVYDDRTFTSALDPELPNEMSTMVLPDVSFFSEIDVLGQTYRSKASRTSRGCYIEVAHSPAIPGQEPEMRIGEVQYFFKHQLQMKKTMLPNGQVFVPDAFDEHTFVFVRWYNPPLHPFQEFECLGAAYYHDSFRPADSDCILPISRIFTCVAMRKGYPDDHVIFLPLPRKTIGF
ncbi:hypothetical protein G6F36_013634 [Rhizopus arrhizus]|nr:hypothetical protein G6F36_013634 [Rhizopus arrhizus]